MTGFGFTKAARGVDHNYCAKRSFRPWVPENLFSFFFFVRSRKIIDFCEGDMKAIREKLNFGGKSWIFEGFFTVSVPEPAIGGVGS